jgi:hypothetical protein
MRSRSDSSSPLRLCVTIYRSKAWHWRLVRNGTLPTISSTALRMQSLSSSVRSLEAIESPVLLSPCIMTFPTVLAQSIPQVFYPSRQVSSMKSRGTLAFIHYGTARRSRFLKAESCWPISGLLRTSGRKRVGVRCQRTHHPKGASIQGCAPTLPETGVKSAALQ